MNGWQSQLLTLLGIPVTQQNINWISNWMNAEAVGNPDINFQGYPYNPLNIKQWPSGTFYEWPDSTTGITNTAQWLQNNGNFNGIGTYADNIKNYLLGLPNNLPASLAWYSGHSGNASQLTTSYQGLLGSQGTANTGTTNTSQTQQTGLPSNQQIAQNMGQYMSALGPIGSLFNLISSASSWQDLVQKLGSDLIISIGAVTFIFIGGLWIILGNQDTKKIFVGNIKDALV